MRHDRLAWPVLLLLLTVLVPSAGVGWMMREAIRNERFASGQQLRDAYTIQLRSSIATLKTQWPESINEVGAKVTNPQRKSSTAFATVIRKLEADGALILEREGRVAYPATTSTTILQEHHDDAGWHRAQQTEFRDQKHFEASELYSQYAASVADPTRQAAAKAAQVRCLVQAKKNDEAVEVLQEIRRNKSLLDASGRSVAATAEARLLDLLEPSSSSWSLIADSLIKRLGDYDAIIPSSQRQFLMSRLEELGANSKNGFAEVWPMRDAERLSMYMATSAETPFPSSRLQASSQPDLWWQADAAEQVVVLYRTDTAKEKLQSMASQQPLPRGLAFIAMPPGESIAPQPLVVDSLGKSMGDWQLGIIVTQDDVFESTFNDRRAFHVWIGGAVVAITCVLAWLLFGVLQQRLRVAQLKNDLVATVSHELKTPLASTRLLVDTLRNAGEEASPTQTSEYLELISRENARLTRMIDHFLTFSRLDRHAAHAEFDHVDINEIANTAATVFIEHYPAAATNLDVRCGPSVTVHADQDAMVTVIVNLLENARKYGADKEPIVLATATNGDQCEITVTDRGVGLTKRQAKRVFDRFYQVDQRVARTSEGCGLGLSIVREIVEAHGGTAKVESRPGVGSTFRIGLPIA